MDDEIFIEIHDYGAFLSSTSSESVRWTKVESYKNEYHGLEFCFLEKLNVISMRIEKAKKRTDKLNRSG